MSSCQGGLLDLLGRPIFTLCLMSGNAILINDSLSRCEKICSELKRSNIMLRKLHGLNMPKTKIEPYCCDMCYYYCIGISVMICYCIILIIISVIILSINIVLILCNSLYVRLVYHQKKVINTKDINTPVKDVDKDRNSHHLVPFLYRPWNTHFYTLLYTL